LEFYCSLYIEPVKVKKIHGKAIRVTGCGRPYGCETSRPPHFLENQLTDGGKVVSLMRRSPFALRKNSGTHFCQRLSRHQGPTAAGMIRSASESNNFAGNRTHDLLACSIKAQPTMLPRAPYMEPIWTKNKLIRQFNADSRTQINSGGLF
jgi:hypothetical protein